ncbi:MAG: DUF2851 family protein [Melioribacteraceae bacterium]|nr:DUF2851 family protein [Melioribacteraceae bacterium]
MHKESKVAETVLYEVWKKQNYKNHLKTLNGDDVEVLDTGTENDSTSGPDFKNARIRIGNFTFVGDIEIDTDYSDWKSHGHNIDNKYNKVILHATLFNKNHYAFVYTRDGRKIPSIPLKTFIDESHLDNLKNELEKLNEHPNSHLKCTSLLQVCPQENKLKFLEKLGIERFEKKCNRVFDRLKELKFLDELKINEPIIRYDLTEKFHERKFSSADFDNKEIWLQVLHELIFEALGYSKNKSQMINLAHRANIQFLKKIEPDGILIQKYEAALFNIAGLIQKEDTLTEIATKSYSESLSINWNSIKSYYDNDFMDEAEWNFFRLRPQNFPTIRIAGGARFIKALLHENLIGTFAKKITEIHNLTVLINSLRSVLIIRGEGFWRNHFVFDQPANVEIKYFVGASRADEILVNVILPFFSVYFEIFGKPALSKKILKMYQVFEQKSDNQIIIDVSKGLMLEEYSKKTIYAQGMIELFRNFCSKNKCLECEIGGYVFN